MRRLIEKFVRYRQGASRAHSRRSSEDGARRLGDENELDFILQRPTLLATRSLWGAVNRFICLRRVRTLGLTNFQINKILDASAFFTASHGPALRNRPEQGMMKIDGPRPDRWK